MTLPGDVTAGGVFWTDRGAGRIQRMNFDGSGLAALSLSGEVTSAGTNVRGLALDVANEFFFWSDNGEDRVLRANFDGTSSVILHEISGSSFPADVRFDPTGRQLYWCDRNRGQIERSSTGGAGLVVIVPDAASTGPYFLDVDSLNGRLYWGGFEDGMIHRANLDGSNRESILTGNNIIRGIRVDTQERMLYWVNRDDRKIHRAPLEVFDSGTIPLTHPSVETVYENLDTPHGLAIDIPARKIYWADTGAKGIGIGGSAISRGDLDGATAVEVIAVGNQPWDVELDRRCDDYDQWVARCFRKDATVDITSPGADPDEDGMENSIEYMFNTPPLLLQQAESVEGLLIKEHETGRIHPAITYRRRVAIEDYLAIVQWSTNLVDWHGSSDTSRFVEAEVNPLGDAMEEVTARSLEPMSAGVPQFIRVAIVSAIPSN